MKPLLLTLSLLSSLPALAEVNHIGGCNAQGLGCKIVETTLPDTVQTFHAEFTLAYRFSCGATLKPFPSKIFLNGTSDPEDRKFVDYIGEGTVKVSGTGPVIIGTTNSQELADLFLNPNCGLFVEVKSVAPSERQKLVWSAARSGAVANLQAVQKIYGKKPQMLFWKKQYNTNPAAFRPIIEKQIATLEGTGNILDSINADLFKAILSDAPDDRAAEAMKELDEVADGVIADAEKLLNDQVNAGLAKDLDLESIIEATKTKMKENP